MKQLQQKTVALGGIIGLQISSQPKTSKYTDLWLAEWESIGLGIVVHGGDFIASNGKVNNQQKISTPLKCGSALKFIHLAHSVSTTRHPSGMFICLAFYWLLLSPLPCQLQKSGSCLWKSDHDIPHVKTGHPAGRRDSAMLKAMRKVSIKTFISYASWACTVSFPEVPQDSKLEYSGGTINSLTLGLTDNFILFSRWDFKWGHTFSLLTPDPCKKLIASSPSPFIHIICQTNKLWPWPCIKTGLWI